MSGPEPRQMVPPMPMGFPSGHEPGPDAVWVHAALLDSDPWRGNCDGVLSMWAAYAAAERSDSRICRNGWALPRGAVWPSDYVLAFLVRALPLKEILDALDETATQPHFEAHPRDLGAFYHRCYDRIRDRETAGGR